MMAVAPASSAFLAAIFRALEADWQEERDLTARVATLSAMGCSLSEIAEQLEVPSVKVRNAFIRLRRIAPQLIREEMQ
jgi:hypothetical protein